MKGHDSDSILGAIYCEPCNNPKQGREPSRVAAISYINPVVRLGAEQLAGDFIKTPLIVQIIELGDKLG